MYFPTANYKTAIAKHQTETAASLALIGLHVVLSWHSQNRPPFQRNIMIYKVETALSGMYMYATVASYPVSTASFFFCMLECRFFFPTCKKKLAVETGYEGYALHTPYSLLHAPSLMLHAPSCSMLHTPSLILHILCSMLHAPSLMLHAPSCSILHTPSLILHILCSMLHHAPCSILQASSSIFYAPCSMLHAPSLILHAPSSMLHAPSSKLHAPCSMLQAPSSMLHAPSSTLQAPCSTPQAPRSYDLASSPSLSPAVEPTLSTQYLMPCPQPRQGIR